MDDVHENRVPEGGIHATAESYDDDDSDLEAGGDIPTIVLNVSTDDEESTSNAENDENDTDMPPPRDNSTTDGQARRSLATSAVATPVGGLWTRSVEVNENTCQRRAEFISAAVIKPSPETELGLSFKMRESGIGLEISAIRPDGLISESGAPLKVGDKVVSVNNFSCDRMDNKHAAKLLREAEGTVTIVLQNSGGDPRMVESMIAKPAPNHPTGIGFASTDSPPQLNVSRIFVDGLFAPSLLSIGDEVVSVNDIPCRELDSAAAADIIKSSPRYVTVKAKKFDGIGVVIATSDDEANLRNDGRMWVCGSKKQMVCCLVFTTAFVILIMYLQFF
jgi:C-terminal processing protease CtpA/Prc